MSYRRILDDIDAWQKGAGTDPLDPSLYDEAEDCVRFAAHVFDDDPDVYGYRGAREHWPNVAGTTDIGGIIDRRVGVVIYDNWRSDNPMADWRVGLYGRDAL